MRTIKATHEANEAYTWGQSMPHMRTIKDKWGQSMPHEDNQGHTWGQSRTNEDNQCHMRTIKATHEDNQGHMRTIKATHEDNQGYTWGQSRPHMRTMKTSHEDNQGYKWAKLLNIFLLSFWYTVQSLYIIFNMIYSLLNQNSSMFINIIMKSMIKSIIYQSFWYWYQYQLYDSDTGISCMILIQVSAVWYWYRYQLYDTDTIWYVYMLYSLTYTFWSVYK